MSHHFDSPTAIEDGRLNLCDLYAFQSGEGVSSLILTVNPDAGRSSSTTFRSEALYEFVVARDGGAVEDLAIRLRFDEPDPQGGQRMTVLRAEGEQSRSGVDGTQLGAGKTAEVLALDGGGSAWFGLALDPFWGDGIALAQFHQAMAEGRYAPEVITDSSSNLFEARNVTAVALQIPNDAFGGDEVALWARVSLYGHAPQRQVSRIGNPMLRPLFFPAADADAEELNAGSPATDVERHGDRVRQAAKRLAQLRGMPDPEAHGNKVAEAFLPDVLRFRPRAPAQYRPGDGNGRRIGDDAYGITMSLWNGGPLGDSPSPSSALLEFPHLGAPNEDELPGLADLLGLREHDPERQPDTP